MKRILSLHLIKKIDVTLTQTTLSKILVILLFSSFVICDESSSIYAQEALPANSTAIDFGSGSSSVDGVGVSILVNQVQMTHHFHLQECT